VDAVVREEYNAISHTSQATPRGGDPAKDVLVVPLLSLQLRLLVVGHAAAQGTSSPTPLAAYAVGLHAEAFFRRAADGVTTQSRLVIHAAIASDLQADVRTERRTGAGNVPCAMRR
jgi:hypothetical protein